MGDRTRFNRRIRNGLSDKPVSSTSSLLQLPPEVRLRIWRFLLGDRLLHIGCALNPSGIDKDTVYHVCLLESTEEIVKKDASANKTNDPRQEYKKLSKHQHYDCYEKLQAREDYVNDDNRRDRGQSNEDFLEQRALKRQKRKDRRRYMNYVNHPIEQDRTRRHRKTLIEPNVLRLCEVIYAEAYEVLYKTNTFSFKSGGVLREFMRWQWPWKDIRSFHFDIQIDKHNGCTPGASRLNPFYVMETSTIEKSRGISLQMIWHTAIGPDQVKTLRFLKKLSIDLAIGQYDGNCHLCYQDSDVGIEPWESRNDTKDAYECRPYRENRLGFSTKLQALSQLRQMTVSAHKVWDGLETAQKLPITQQWLKETVLDPQGKLKYKQRLQRQVQEGRSLSSMQDDLHFDGEVIHDLELELLSLKRIQYEKQINFEKQQKQFKLEHGTSDFKFEPKETLAWLERDHDSSDSETFSIDEHEWEEIFEQEDEMDF